MPLKSTQNVDGRTYLPELLLSLYYPMKMNKANNPRFQDMLNEQNTPT